MDVKKKKLKKYSTFLYYFLSIKIINNWSYKFLIFVKDLCYIKIII